MVYGTRNTDTDMFMKHGHGYEHWILHENGNGHGTRDTNTDMDKGHVKHEYVYEP